MNNQIVTYIDEQGLLASGISGYRRGHSTTTVLLGIRDDVIKAMKRGEVTMMVCADYSKAFDTVQFKAVLMKMHGMGFSKKFLRWVLNYLCERQQFVQIDDASSELATVEFGVPHGSILGPILFNLYVSDLHEKLKCPCYQYADDTTFYQHTKVADSEHCATQMNNTISRLGQYSNESNLALNGKKTKWLLLSTRQMSRLHGLQDAAVQLTCNGETLERVQSIKLLGVTMDEHFSWIEHVKALLSSCYGVLSVLRKLRNLAPFHVRKQLGESLILSKLDYSCVVFHPLQLYQQKQLQKVQNVCASFVLGRYAREADSPQLGWLPVAERRQFQVLLSAFKALYFSNWPEYIN